jgi:hypothetical protein
VLPTPPEHADQEKPQEEPRDDGGVTQADMQRMDDGTVEVQRGLSEQPYGQPYENREIAETRLPAADEIDRRSKGEADSLRL